MALDPELLFLPLELLLSPDEIECVYLYKMNKLFFLLWGVVLNADDPTFKWTHLFGFLLYLSEISKVGI